MLNLCVKNFAMKKELKFESSKETAKALKYEAP